MELSDILDLARQMGLILGLAFYVAIVIWTYKDARKRTDDPIMVATFTAITMLPLFGVFIYMLVRPAEYIADMRERELEIRALERQLGRQERCPYCKSHIEGDYLSCPVCTTKLRTSCAGCEKPLDPRWVMCPFCETEVPGHVERISPAASAKSSRGTRSSVAERTHSSSAGTSSSSSPSNDKVDRKDGQGRSRPGGRPSSKPASGRPKTHATSSTSASSASKSSSGKSTQVKHESTKATATNKTQIKPSPSKKSDHVDIQTEPFGSGDKTK